AATGPDVILGGHEHEPLIAEEGKTLITKAGSDARYLVQVDLWVARDGPLVERSWTFREVSRRVPADPAVEALVQGYARRLEGDLDVVVGRTGADLEARSGRLTTGETNLGDFVADAMRERLQSEVAVLDYLYRGGDGFTEFGRAKALVSRESGPQLGDLVLDAIARHGTIAPVMDGRIRRAGN